MSSKISKKVKQSDGYGYPYKNTKGFRTISSESMKALTEDLTKIKNEAVSEALIYSTNIMFATFALVLHDHFGFGHKRTVKALQEVEKTIERATAGEITVQDLLAEVEKVLDIKIDSSYSKKEEEK
jgi:hypothetical protein